MIPYPDKLSANQKKILIIIIFLLVAAAFHVHEIFFSEAYLFNDHIYAMGRFFDMYRGPSPWSIYQWTDKVHFGFSWARESGGIYFHLPEYLLTQVVAPFRTFLFGALFWYVTAQIFTYLFLRLFNASRSAAVVGAIMFSFSGTIVRDYTHYCALIIIATTPVLFWLAESLARRLRLSLAVLTVLVIANNFLAPHPQYIAYQIPILGMYYGIRTVQIHGFKKGMWRWFIFAAILAFAVLLAAPRLLPLQDQIAGSISAYGRGTQYSMIGNVLKGWRWSRLLLVFHALLAPLAVGSDLGHKYVPSLVNHSYLWSIYVGVLPWFCLSGLWRLRRRFELIPFLLISILAVWFLVPKLFMPLLPDFRTIYGRIPIWNMFHFYERFLFLGTFSLSVLLALSLDSWVRYRSRLGMLIPLLLLVVLGGICIASSLFHFLPEWLPGQIRMLFSELAVRSGGQYIINTKIGSAMSVFLLVSFILVAARSWFRLPRSAFMFVALVILVSDLLCYGLPAKPTVDVKRFLSAPPLARIIPEDSRFIRVASDPSWIWKRNVDPIESRRSLESDMNLFYGLRDAAGFTMPVLSEEEYQLFDLMLMDTWLRGRWHKNEISDSKQLLKTLDLWRLYSIDYLITDMELDFSGLSLVGRDREFRLYRILKSLPRIYCSSSMEVMSDWDALMQRFSEFDLSNSPTCHVLKEDFEKEARLSDGIVISVSSRGSTDISVEVEAGEKGTFLVQTDRWTKEWRATLDEEPVRLYKVNGMQRGVYVPSGRHTVRFQYYDRQLVLGLWLAGFGLLIMTVVSIWISLDRSSKIDLPK